MLNADKHIEVIGSAVNGSEAVTKVAELKPDVITMDIEMPVMDGIAATKKIMMQNPTPVLMFSSLTTEGAKATLDALDAGAVDFLPKKIDDIASERDTARRLLCARVRVLGARGLPEHKAVTHRSSVNSSQIPHTQKPPVRNGASLELKKNKLIAIGTSTGGPVALQKILTRVPAGFPQPILVIQHMPASFTPSFSERLDSLCNIRVKQAEHGETLLPDTAYIAPGGEQTTVSHSGGRMTLNIEAATSGQTYKPSVDLAFTSIATICSSDVLAMVLTGMGADGREGARLLKQKGATIWAQDEASCVIYGMPMAIVEANLADEILSLDEIATIFGKET